MWYKTYKGTEDICCVAYTQPDVFLFVKLTVLFLCEQGCFKNAALMVCWDLGYFFKEQYQFFDSYIKYQYLEDAEQQEFEC